MRHAARPFALALSLALAGCAPDATTAEEDPGAEAVAPGTVALIELHALDAWAQPLPATGRALDVRLNGSAARTVPGGRAWSRYVELRGAGTYRVTLDAPEHRGLAVSLRFDGTTGLGAVSLSGAAPEGHGLSLSHGVRTVGRRALPVHAVYLGLRHAWFSAQGRPARRGNGVRLLMDGEEAWSSVHAALRGARQTVHASTWWWESDFELLRDAATHATLSADARRGNTILALLEASPARKRVLVGQFLGMDGLASSLSSDAALRAHGEDRGDNFEHMGEANPASGMFTWEVPGWRFEERVREAQPELAAARFDPESPVRSDVPGRAVDLTQWPVRVDVDHASWHQKFLVVDDRVAFIGGMNLRRVDWDTSAHRVFDHRRMLFGATADARAAVLAREALPDTGPRKDYMVRVEGPIARDAQDVFHRRWQRLLREGARFSDDATDFTVPAPAAPVAGGVQAQVTATMPAPYGENAIAETWFNAVRNARSYIFIEDQYFRIPMLTEEIARRMTEVPALRLVIVTKPVSEWTDPGCAWTHRTWSALQERFADRMLTLQLRAFDTQVTWGVDETDAHFIDMDVHSKLLLVDDVFLSVGSANKNNRGVIYEGELNVAVLDATWVRDARRRVIANLLPPGAAPGDALASWWRALADAAQANAAVRARWEAEGDDVSLDGAALPAALTPRGFVYPLTFRRVEKCLFESVGPDMT
jgi:phosphatidylserine/phosphatidylglycerophosphate/cardiolipin synthase-like enzyme